MDFDFTKVKKTSFNEETDPPAVLDAPLETHAKALEVYVAEPVISTGEDACKETEKAVELPEEKLAMDAALISAEEKLIAENVEKPATDTIHTVAKEKPIIETDEKIQVEKPATKDDDKVHEEKTETKTIKVPEEKSATEAFEEVEEDVEELLKEKPTVETVQEEKSESKIIDELLEVKAIKLKQPATSEALQNQPKDTEKTYVLNQTVEPAEGLRTETIDHFGKVYETDCITVGMLEIINGTENKPETHGQIDQVDEKNKDSTDENRNFELMKVEGTKANLKEKEITPNKKHGTIETPLFEYDEPQGVQLEVEEDSSSKIAKRRLKEQVSVKSSPKTPGSMISRVKQSMIKVKRAIIGKSPGSKTIKTKIKGDEETK